jgi:hypothetical protein
MASPQPTLPTVATPLTDLTDQRVIQILSTEHWSLLGARSLAYNEAFTRGGMFLTFLSTSFVALALFSTAMSFGSEFLTVAGVVLAFDLVIGLATYTRITGANQDDLRALHGMARIRHSYTQIAPIVAPYFTAATHDDIDSVLTAYGAGPNTANTGFTAGIFLYALTTSGGMIGLITCMVAGVLGAVLALLAGLSGGVAVWVGVGAGVAVFIALLALTLGAVPRYQAELTSLFPAPSELPATDS